MNPGAIYSKSGKGVQEASGKTSLLKRADRAVLSAIDGRANLGEVAQKVGKPFDAAFQSLIAQLDRDGFIREVTAAASTVAPPPRPASGPPTVPPRAAPKPAPGGGDDLDFTGIMASPLKAPPPKPSAPKPAAAKPAAAKPAFDPNTTQRLQEEALYKARQEAEARAQEQRDRLRAEAEARARSEAEAKVRAETEKRLREEAEAKAKAEAEAKAKAAREAAVRMAAEAKAKAEAEARAKIEAERRAREEAERKAREEAERAKREAEELRLRLEEERRAREEAERKAREEAERKEAERRAREEAERRAREEAERREAERRAREEAERKAREEAERRAREEAERKARAEAEAQMRRAREEAERKRAEAERREAEARKSEPLPEIAPLPPAAQAAPAGGGESLDALMADLDSFTQRDEDERKAREAAEQRAREERQRQQAEENERREREQAERERAQAEERRRQEAERYEEERRAREAEERRAREEAEREREEAEERERRAREVLAAQQSAGSDDIGVTDADLDMDDVRRDEAAVAKESRKARREREREQKRLEKEARERAREAAKAAARAKAKDDEALGEIKIKKVRRKRNWGRPVALTLFVLLAAGLGLLHVMPVPTQDYERAASAALGQPVRIGSARLSLVTGVQLILSDVAIGQTTRVGSARAYPALGSLFGEDKVFSRVELDGVALRQAELGDVLFARAGAQNFKLERIIVRNLKLEGALPVPALEADVRLANDGSVRTVDLRGPDNLLGQLLPKGGAVNFDITANSIALPFATDVELTSFAMKGRADREAMRIESWGGTVLGGALSGTATLRWGRSWQVDGVVTARGINAAGFAPALLAEGYAEGSGKFFLAGTEPAKLLRSGRVEGSFTIGKGMLGSFDLSRAIRTDGREVEGSTRFVELNGQGTYDRGAVALRNVVIGAGALQAGASADISQSGALSGRIVADIRTPSQSLRATLLLGGTVKEPRVRN